MALFFGLSEFFWRRAQPVMDVNQSLRMDVDQSLRDVDQSLRINPFNDRAYYLRGILKEIAIEKNSETGKQDISRTQSAIADFEKAGQINPLEPHYDYHRVMNYLAIHPDKLGEAVFLCRSVLEKDPWDPELCYLVASDLLDLNQGHDRSVEDFAKGLLDRALKLDPRRYSGAMAKSGEK